VKEEPKIYLLKPSGDTGDPKKQVCHTDPLVKADLRRSVRGFSCHRYLCHVLGSMPI